MSELEVRTDNTLTLHGTGEAFDLAEPEQVARALVAIDRYLEHVREAYRDRVVAELWEIGRERGTQTLHFDTVTILLSDNEEHDWDIAGLRERMPAAGLPQERLDLLIKVEVREKVDLNVAKQLRGANEAYAKILDDCRTTIPASRFYARRKR